MVEVILIKDTPNVGKRGELCSVSDGYADNYLIPRGFAVIATEGAVKAVKQQLSAKARKHAEEISNAQEVAQTLATMTLEIPAKAGGNGRLFGAVTNVQVAEAIFKTLNVEIDKHKIEMDKSEIKALGTYPVRVRLGNNVIATTTIQVVKAPTF